LSLTLVALVSSLNVAFQNPNSAVDLPDLGELVVYNGRTLKMMIRGTPILGKLHMNQYDRINQV
jgi:hypothetical protein